MVLEVIGSSSAGNAYLLKGRSSSLIIEAGVAFSAVKRALNWDLDGVRGCLVSHVHGDHSGFIADVMDAGITVYALGEVLAMPHRRAFFGREIEPMKGYVIGEFRVFAFPVVHDVPCLGFVIDHEEMGRLLFVTDTMMLEYRFPGLNHIMIEANYADDILLDNIDRGIEPAAMKGRLLRSHMELGTALGILRANDLSDVRDITLIHLSSRNSDAARFRAEAEAATGIPTYIAEPGLEINISRNFMY